MGEVREDTSEISYNKLTSPAFAFLDTFFWREGAALILTVFTGASVKHRAWWVLDRGNGALRGLGPAKKGSPAGSLGVCKS